MTMNTKHGKFLGLIEEALGYNQPEDNEIKILESTLLEAGLTKQDLAWNLKKSTFNKVIAGQKVMFAATKTQSSYPKAAELSSVSSNDYSQPVYLLKIDRSALALIEAKPTPSDKPSFDENSGKIFFNGKESEIPLKTNQYFLCKKLFSETPGKRVKEIDILDMIDWSKDGARSVYDSMRAVNTRAKRDLGILELFCWRNNTIWIKEL